MQIIFILFRSPDREADSLHEQGNPAGPRLLAQHAENASGYQGCQHSTHRKCGCKTGGFWCLCTNYGNSGQEKIFHRSVFFTDVT